MGLFRRKISSAARRSRSPRTLRHFLVTRNANAAIEFALIAPAFIALLMAILQVGLVFVAQSVLQTATSQASRLIMTGQAQNSGLTAAQFQQDVCNYATSLFNCAGIYVNVQTFSTFSSIAMTNPVSGGTFNTGSLGYSTGGAGDIVVVQVFYEWPVYLAPLNFNLANVGSNYDVLVATAAFRTEPY
jgi:Flp pilus assembly protein TadG